MDKRKIIIDTDTASDDAVALVMALRDPSVEVVAITTVAGNMPLSTCTRNALISIDYADTYAPPVYEGCPRPLAAKQISAEGTHGDDGMGNHNYQDPKGKKQDKDAVRALIDLIDAAPAGTYELVTLGPLTNIALAIVMAPDAMKKIKVLTMMGSGGLGSGNCTPVAEFNIEADAEACEVVLQSGIPCVIVGWDACIGEAMLWEDEIEDILATGSRCARFCIECNDTLRDVNLRRFGSRCIDFADPVAMAAAIYPDCIKDSLSVRAMCEIKSDSCYGQVVIDRGGFGSTGENNNAVVVSQLDGSKFKKYLKERIV